jgi:hypothetical protein
MSTVAEIEAAIEQLPAAERARLRNRLMEQTSRVSNVDPLADTVAKRLYSESDDDTDTSNC